MNWHIVSWVFLVALLQDGTATPTTEQLVKSDLGKFESDWPVGDSRRCQEQLRLSKFDVKRFEVIPGIGWDNLRNVEGGLVVSYNFTQCKVTDDGRLLIPDNVFTVPIKSSSVETFAELNDHWLNTSSTTSNTINIQAGLSTSSVSVSGGFSYEHEQVKSKQIEDKAVTTRVQMRYTRYEAKLQPDPVLSPQFKNRLLSIAANVQLNYTEQARYEAQLLVRDFGTHVLTSVTAGAALVKDDYLQREYVLGHTEQKTSILASASASFFSLVHVSASYGHKTDATVDDMYQKIMTHSYTKSYGGPLFKPGNMSLDDWTDGVDDNLVPIDRSGDPLYFLITPTLLPELPSTTVAEVEKIVRQSIELYYEMNTIRGCTKLGAPNFSFSANFDDGSCHAKPTNLTFGGVFQKCAANGQYLNHNPCDGLNVVNPKTGGMSCPPSYTAVVLQSGRRNAQTEERTDCHSYWIFWKRCHTTQFYSEAVYSTYWCAATGPVAPESGYLFGGLYTSTTENVVIGAKGCPASFYARQMFTDLQICISDDYEFAQAFSVPFGGFFSCKSGNPLAAEGAHPVGAKKAAVANTLRSFMENSENSWPSKCPEGYSQHIATDDMGCSIHYCVQTGALSGPALPPVKRPPFMKKPATFLEQDNLLIFNEETKTWMKNERAKAFQSTLIAEPSKQNNNSGKEMSPGVAAAISVAATLGCIGIATLIIVMIRKRKSNQQGPYRRLTDETFEQPASYGSTRPESGVINETA
ncbi:unnamed protein product [Candidula unifasciata]|uniref:MACPF domain-containing protein n=1 Tax=Candidula unifasciata TaxID=100452 RepID=A0A8S3YV84_9EUPU|nr:unnamed protein product [Candidula unifasciata]